MNIQWWGFLDMGNPKTVQLSIVVFNEDINDFWVAPIEPYVSICIHMCHGQKHSIWVIIWGPVIPPTMGILIPNGHKLRYKSRHFGWFWYRRLHRCPKPLTIPRFSSSWGWLDPPAGHTTETPSKWSVRRCSFFPPKKNSVCTAPLPNL